MSCVAVKPPSGGRWKVDVIRQLKRRDQRQHEAFSDLIRHYSRMLEKSSISAGFLRTARVPSGPESLSQNDRLKTMTGEAAPGGSRRPQVPPGDPWWLQAPGGSRRPLVAPGGPRWLQAAPVGFRPLVAPGPWWLQAAPGGSRRPLVAPGGPWWLQAAPGGSRRPQVAPGGPRWLQAAPGGSRLPLVAPGGPRWLQAAPGGSRLPLVAPGGPRWLQAAPGGSRRPLVAPGCPWWLQDAPGGFRQPLTTVCPPGFLEVIVWPLAGRLNVSRSWRPDLGAGQLHYYGQVAALNDCVYRNMYRSHYLGLHDMDELILPQAVDSWTELLPQLELKHGPGRSYVFQNHVFPTSISGTPSAPSSETRPTVRWQEVEGVNILDHLYHEPPDTVTWSNHKIIVDPRAVVQPTVHGLLNPTHITVTVPPSVARMYHTRAAMKAGLRRINLTFDGRLLDYRDRLVRVVDEVLERTGLLHPSREGPPLGD
ncbi:uncharacterized protein LOC130406694 [Gadus chalcogrammus]|uniref:uncharacterized protein LOC130406694 n=1 Tax=Gadus chalcogrammus TaxID=1042646 RepID=UPI0024C4D610|nr:uncharacterized protein LOC130406694 [Gadus chalcogrammus]